MNFIKNNKKGFSMVELLGAILILGIISLIAIVSVTRLISRSKKDSDSHSKNMLLMAAQSYYAENRSELPKEIGESNEVNASTLRSNNYLKSDIKSGNGESCMNVSYVKVVKKSKSDYKYTAYLYCGSETRGSETTENVPRVEAEFTSSDKSNLVIKDGAIQNVSSARLKITIYGSDKEKTSENKKVMIAGYNFTISAKIDDEELREVYSSGSLSANNEAVLHIDKPLSDYVNITKATNLVLKVNVRNSEGGEVSKIFNAGEEGSGSSDKSGLYHDTTPPTCKLDSNDDDVKWINKNSLPSEQRTIVKMCDDGEGSGCIRDKFAITWPNDYQEEAEYAYVQVKDNAGNKSISDDYLQNSSICDMNYVENACRVKVFVDRTSPKVTIQAYKAKDGGKEGDGLFADSVIKTSNNTNHATVSVSYNAYNSKANLQNGWFNEKFPKGVAYEITVTDGIHLSSLTWKTNKKNIKSSSSDDYKKVDVNNPDGFSKNYDQGLDMTHNNCGIRSDKLIVYFTQEGMRYGELTVKDKAGNKTVYKIEANIDYTRPTAPTIGYYKWKNNDTRPNKSDGLSTYSPGTWSKYRVFTIPSGSTDNLSKVSYRYTTTGATTNEKNKVGTYRNVEANGKSTITYQACDVAMNCTPYPTAANIWIDTVAPNCTSSGGGGWTPNDITLKGSCSDATSGCKNGSGSDSNKIKTTYSGGNVYKLYYPDVSFNLTNQSPGTVYDNAGNSKNCPANQTVKIDKTRPVISNIGFSGYNNRQVVASCYDGESGVVNSSPVINTSSGWNTLTCQNNAGLTNSDSKYATYNSCKSGANTCRYNSCCYGSPYTCGGDYVSYTTQESIRYCNNSVSATTYNGYSCRGACTGNDCRGGSCEHMCYKTVTNYYWDSCAYYYNSCSSSYCCTGSNTCAYGYD
ncbi:MAG: prepilin-type N-terminal cleavage/methylation domain-containing protein [Bacilli bacterium]|nr:prepilin-type N-terminal cleavage/methylation domain-containing protein [Bacilli bacterium]